LPAACAALASRAAEADITKHIARIDALLIALARLDPLSRIDASLPK
jgi:hypothetical protein